MSTRRSPSSSAAPRPRRAKRTPVSSRAFATWFVGSHTQVPFAERGRAYFRETELLVEAGLTPAEVIRAATERGAEFLRRERDLGTLRAGMLADLIVVEGDPARDIRALRSVRRVMVGGRWIPIERYRDY
ncbi:MAG: hypothetical protein DMG07_22705 [Acidobacteria bacterium]|nr:MAG: hypothetical protein DMG07_22705 [Acidobacteriota bacterium]